MFYMTYPIFEFNRNLIEIFFKSPHFLLELSGNIPVWKNFQLFTLMYILISYYAYARYLHINVALIDKLLHNADDKLDLPREALKPGDGF